MDLQQIVGACVGGRYRLEGILGVGGMGAVFSGRDVGGGHGVAVKILNPKLRTEQMGARLRREARLIGKISHPNVVQLLDHGVDAAHGFYMVMERVDGLAMSALPRHALDSKGVIGLIVQVLGALAHVHARGILHRDVKPDNVLVARDRGGDLVAKLTDFGIAAAQQPNPGETRLTGEGAVLGTPDYMAPEQVMGAALMRPSVDLYPVGVMIYEAFAGVLPFDGQVMQVLLRKLHEDVAPPPGVASWPEGCWAVVARLLARQPDQRFESASEAAHALTPFMQTPTVSEEAWRAHLAHRATTPSTAHATYTADITEQETQHALRPLIRGLWGRNEEVALLLKLADVVESQGRPRIVLVSGEGGVGKSLLTSEVGLMLAERGRFELLRTSYQASADAEGGLRGVLDRFLGTVGATAARVEQAVRELLQRDQDTDPREVEDLVSFLRPRLFDQQQGNQQRLIFALVMRFLRRLVRRKPVLLLLDDVHGGGEDSAAFLQHALFELRHEPCALLIVGTLRRGVRRDFEAHVTALKAREEFFSLELAALPQEALARALEQEGLHPDLARQIAQRADGNPLFARLLAGANTALLRTSSAQDAPARQIQTPESIYQMIESNLSERLASAPTPEVLRQYLVRMAILGQRVGLSLLRAFTQELQGDFDDHLDHLIASGLLVEDERAEVVSFSHGLIADALRAGLNRRQSQRLHRAAAELRASLRTQDAAGAIGDHFEAAGDITKALSWWIQALAYETTSGDASRGLAYGLKVLPHLPDDDLERVELSLKLGLLYQDLGQFDNAIATLNPLMGPDVHPDQMLRAGEQLAQIYHNKGQYSLWESTLEAMNAHANGATSRGLAALSRAQIFWRNHTFNTQIPPSALLAEFQQAPADEQSILAPRLAWSCYFNAAPEISVQIIEQALAHPNQPIEVVAELLRTLAFMLTGMNDDEGSLRACTQALDLWKRSGRHGKVVRSSIDRLFMSWLASRSALGLEGEADIALAIQDINAEAEHARFDIMRFLCAIDLDRAAPELVERVRGLLPQLQPLGFGVLVPAIQICLVLHALRQDQHEEAARYILAMSFDRCPFSPVVVQQVTERLTHAVVASPTPLLRQTLHHYLRGLQKLWKAFKRPHLRHAVSEHLADLTQRQMIP